MSLPYLEASKQYKAGKVTWDEYIDHLMSRATAAGGHIDDERTDVTYTSSSSSKLQKTDPFAYSVWLWTGNYMLKGK
jgi:hypothetical protein